MSSGTSVTCIIVDQKVLSCGVPGQTHHELVQAGCRRVSEACRVAGKAAGLHVVRPEPTTIIYALRR